MKYLKQLAIIFLFSFIGDALNVLLPLPVPASMYGLILLFICLCIGIIKLEQIQEAAGYLLLIMPITFLSPNVGIIESYLQVKGSILALVVIALFSTALVMTVTGRTAQFLIRHRARKGKQK
ncbi:MAG: CidA/LrgA family protein [Clostridia bacterium]|nr:CidA/LrgA family protein [Clostridia bacterium]